MYHYFLELEKELLQTTCIMILEVYMNWVPLFPPIITIPDQTSFFLSQKKKESVKTLQTHQQHLHKYIITFITTFFLIKVLLYTFIFFFLFAKGEYSLFCMYTYRILTLPLFLTPHLRLAFTNRIIQKWTNCPTKVSLFTFYNLFV